MVYGDLHPGNVLALAATLDPGADPDAGRFAARAREAGVGERVRFLDSAADLRQIYAMADCVLAPARSEAVPEGVLEAMAMGKAVLASDVGGHRELIENGKTGLLFEAENSADLVKQATRLATDLSLRNQLGEAGRQYVQRERSWGKLAERYVAIYEELLEGKAQRAKCIEQSAQS